MPELPEVETVRRGLEPAMAGRRLARVIQRRPDLRFLLPQGFATRLTGRRIESLGRRAKYLLARLDGGEVLIMHLGMSGRFTITPSRRLDGISSPLAGEVARSAGGGRGEAAPTNNARSAGGGKAPSSASGSPPPPLRGTSPARGEEKKRLVGEFTLDTGTDPAHDHIVFETDDGTLVTYNDPRRFGFMDLVPDSDLDTCRHFAGMGPEPLGNTFDSAYLATRAFGRSADIKTFLLDQRNIAGLGNIYVCEALFRIGLSPHRAASCLAIRGAKPSDRCQRLVPAIRDVLTEAIAAGGSTLRDYAKADGSLGYFQHSFKVYGREGEPCTTQGCVGMIKRTVQGGRSTFHCGRCQR